MSEDRSKLLVRVDVPDIKTQVSGHTCVCLRTAKGIVGCLQDVLLYKILKDSDVQHDCALPSNKASVTCVVELQL